MAGGLGGVLELLDFLLIFLMTDIKVAELSLHPGKLTSTSALCRGGGRFCLHEFWGHVPHGQHYMFISPVVDFMFL